MSEVLRECKGSGGQDLDGVGEGRLGGGTGGGQERKLVLSRFQTTKVL